MAGSPVKAPAEPVDVTISNGTAITAEINLAGRVPVALVMPSAWTAADITFQMAPTVGGTFVDLYDTAEAEHTITVAASRCVALDPVNFLGCRSLKVRSGTTGTPVNQLADRTITLMLADPERI